MFMKPKEAIKLDYSSIFQVDYCQRDSVFKFVRKLLALPFLPEEQIPTTFYALKEAVTTPKLLQLTDYIERAWITNETWNRSTWTVYRMAVRTNNDVEGWHHRLNRKAQKSCLPFYVLIILLFKEVNTIPTQLKMVSEGKLRRYQRKTTRLLQCRINKLWDDYNDGKLSVNKLLKKCGQIYANH
jgi:hypothetical protein